MTRPSSRRYVKRLWRVPKNRGALEYFAVLVTKLLVKHGWPAKWQEDPQAGGFVLLSHDDGENIPADFMEAIEIAVKITARTYRVEVAQYQNFVALSDAYAVTSGGQLKKSRVIS